MNSRYRLIVMTFLPWLSATAVAQTTICVVTDPLLQFTKISWSATDKSAKLTTDRSSVFSGTLRRVEKHDYSQNKFNLYFKTDSKYLIADEIELLIYPVGRNRQAAAGANYKLIDGVRYLNSTIAVFSVECNTH